jgi:hypothetical protein
MLMALDILLKRVYLAGIDKGHQAWYSWIKKGRWMLLFDSSFLSFLACRTYEFQAGILADIPTSIMGMITSRVS